MRNSRPFAALVIACSQSMWSFNRVPFLPIPEINAPWDGRSFEVRHQYFQGVSNKQWIWIYKQHQRDSDCAAYAPQCKLVMVQIIIFSWVYFKHILCITSLLLCMYTNMPKISSLLMTERTLLGGRRLIKMAVRLSKGGITSKLPSQGGAILEQDIRYIEIISLY